MSRPEYVALATSTLFCVWTAAAPGDQATEPGRPPIGTIHREDPRFDRLVPPDAKIELLASGLDWSEGPVWIKQGGYLLFSDVPRNVIHRWHETEGLSVYMSPSGFTGVGTYSQEPGSNGLTLDARGRLILCEHGDRRVSRLEPSGGKLTLADMHEGRRLNSPNDVVVKSNGDVYFTDPPYGLPKLWDSPLREQEFSGVYRVSPRDRTVTLLSKDLTRPNGIAFSPDEKTLYVANSDAQAIWMAYPVLADGTLGSGRVFADVSDMAKTLKGAPDGLKVDRDGNLWATGPGGVHVMAPDGTRLGRLDTGERVSNCAWGDDGSTLYITSDMNLVRIKTTTRGAGW
jgi:gluconolactonase